MSANDVYTKLRTAPDYHPSSVDLFDDCTLQAGDVVTVRSGSDSYSLPIFSQHLVWNGASTVQLESTGNEKRSDLPALRKKSLNTSYGLGSGAYGTQKGNEAKFKKYETHFEQTDEYFSLLATESEWDELAQEGHVTAYTQILQTARDITTVAAKTGIDGLAENETLYSKINQNAESISTEVARAQVEETSLSTRITQTATDITSLVTKTGVNSLGQNETLYSKINQNAESITTKVGKGEISSTINQTAQGVLIQAEKINLSGYVTVDDLEATNASISNLTSGKTSATLIITTALRVSHGFVWNEQPVAQHWFTVGNKTFWAMVTENHMADRMIVDYSDIPHYHAITATENNGQIVLTLGAAQAEEGTTNFNIAATQAYIDGVAAAKASIGITGSWKDGIYTASTTGQATAHTVSTELSEILLNGTPSKSGTYGLLVPVKVVDIDNATILTDNVTASAKTVWDAVTLSGSWNDGTYTVTAANGKTDSTELSEITNNGTPTKSGKSIVVPCKVTTTDGKTVLTDNVTGNASAVYNDGWAAARGKCSAPSAGTSTSFSVGIPSETVDESTSYTFTLTKGTPSASGGYVSVSRAGTVVARIDISNWWTKGYEAGVASVDTTSYYNSGWAAARAKVSIPTSGRGNRVKLYVPSATVGNQSYYIYKLTEDGTYAYIKYGSNTVATITLQ